MPLSSCFLYGGFHSFVVPDVQGRSIHALRHDLVNVLGHDSAISLAIEYEHFNAVFLLGILLRLGSLRLMEDVAQVRYEERDLLDGLRSGAACEQAPVTLVPNWSFSHVAASAPRHRPEGDVVGFVEELFRRL